MINLEKQVIYQIFVRQYAQKKPLVAIKEDLGRILEMGADILYLMPIYPIAKVNRKGSVGSPYAAYDYTALDPNLGTMEELKALIEEVHKKRKRIIVDIALNHTGCNSVLLETHPEYFLTKNGKISRKCEDWSDVYDLDYNNKELYPLITEILCNWLKVGFDGFRMDVCSMIPISFWQYAKAEMVKIKPDLILVGESVEPPFLEYIRSLGVEAPSDQTLFTTFDILYQYDIPKSFGLMKEDLANVDLYLKDLKKGLDTLGQDKLRLRYLENHDLERVASHKNLSKHLETLWAFDMVLPGVPFIYMGGEYGVEKRPDLFEVDLVDLKTKKRDFTELFKRISWLRKCYDFLDYPFEYEKLFDYAYVLYYGPYIFIFNFSDEKLGIKLDGEVYINLYDAMNVYPKDGKVIVDNFMLLKELD